LAADNGAERSNDLREVVKQSKAEGHRWSTVFQRFFRPGVGWRLGYLTVAVTYQSSITVGHSWLPVISEKLNGLGEYLAGAIAILPAFTIWMRWFLAEANGKDASIGKLDESKQNLHKSVPANSGVELAEAKAVEARAQEVSARIAWLKQRHAKRSWRRISEPSSRARLGRFIEQRAQSGYYRGQLGANYSCKTRFRRVEQYLCRRRGVKRKGRRLKLG